MDIDFAPAEGVASAPLVLQVAVVVATRPVASERTVVECAAGCPAAARGPVAAQDAIVERAAGHAAAIAVGQGKPGYGDVVPQVRARVRMASVNNRKQRAIDAAHRHGSA